MNWQSAIERTVAGLGYDLVDVEKSAGGLLRIFIDHAAGGSTLRFITVDDCEKVTRQLQHVLEVESCAYERLEVSSPGLDRPLKRMSDYQRFVGEQVEVTLRLPFKGRKKYRGELQLAGEAWRLILADANLAGKAALKAPPGAELTLDFSLEEVRDARLVPKLDFKGLRLAPRSEGKQPDGSADRPVSSDEIDGGRIQ